MSGASTGKPVLQFNLECVKATAGFGLGWVLWRVAGGDPVIWFFAVVFVFAGAKRGVVALYLLVKLILGLRKLAKFKAKGADPKADPMAREKDLRKKGLTR